MPLFGLATMAASTPMLSAALLFFVPVITGGSGSGSVGASTALDDVCGGMGGYYMTPELGVLCADPSSRRRPGSRRPTPPQPETASLEAARSWAQGR